MLTACTMPFTFGKPADDQTITPLVELKSQTIDPLPEKSAYDQKVMAFITDIEMIDGKRHVTIDPVNWLNGDAAVQAKIKDHECPDPKSCLPNGFYIENSSHQTQEIILPYKTPIQRSTDFRSDSPNGKRMMVFEDFINWYQSNTELFQHMPFNFYLKGNTAVHIVEQYVP